MPDKGSDQIPKVAVRVLVAIEPRMYREVLAFHFRRQRPGAQVLLASPQTLGAEAKRVRPHLIVADEVPPELKETSFWAEVRADEGFIATILRSVGASALMKSGIRVRS